VSNIVLRVLANGATVYGLQLPRATDGTHPVFLLPEGAAPRVLIDYTGAARGVTVATSVWTGPVTGAFLDAAKASALIQAGGSGDVRHVLTMADGVVFVTRFRVAREDMYHV
jgi:predicted TIM-barrel enzyme